MSPSIPESHDGSNIYMAIMRAGPIDIFVDPELCCGCGLCIVVCPQGVFSLKDGVSQTERIDDCLQCHLCEVACEYHAIAIREG
jgi:NAD-dependent dihydropyrimidine dehydrogenase PreA subunit